MKTLILTYFVLGLLLNIAVWWATDASAQGDRQLCRSMQPSSVELQVARQGRVVNYDRIEHMMFTRTVATDDSGSPARLVATHSGGPSLGRAVRTAG